MAHINLLPWRAELRKEKQREFMSIMAGSAILMLVVVAYVHIHISTLINNQQSRNNYLKKEIYQPISHEKTVEKIKNNPSISNFNSFEISRQDILKKVYPSADLFILPSMQEGVPYVLQEG